MSGQETIIGIVSPEYIQLLTKVKLMVATE